MSTSNPILSLLSLDNTTTRSARGAHFTTACPQLHQSTVLRPLLHFLDRNRKLEERLKLVLIVPFDLEVCKAYGNLKGSLKTASGSDRVVSTNDLWIAA